MNEYKTYEITCINGVISIKAKEYEIDDFGNLHFLDEEDEIFISYSVNYWLVVLDIARNNIIGNKE